MSLDTVVSALEGTGFELVTVDDPPPTAPARPGVAIGVRPGAPPPPADVGYHPSRGSRPTSSLASVADRGASRAPGGPPGDRPADVAGGTTSSVRGPTEQPQWYAR